MKPFVKPGSSPILLAQPHGGIEIPDAILVRLNAAGQARADTDWHISRLYNDLLPNATVVSTPVHRYVVDVNRDPADASLYPDQNTTSLCPTTDFDGTEIYLDGQAPSQDEISERQQHYHQPYHDAVRAQLERIHQAHGYAILYDCHSIRSQLPFLFEGRLPDFNIGTNSGSSCDLAIESEVLARCLQSTQYSSVLNGRFKGGWTTRHYGEPGCGIHAIQMELAQCNYMIEESPWHYVDDKARKLRVILGDILQTLTKILD